MKDEDMTSPYFPSTFTSSGTPAARSLWVDTLPEPEGLSPTLSAAHRRALRSGDLKHADVVIIGAGYTGLWTALELLRRAPDCDVVVLEREHVGFGASGRNGGWCSAILPMSLDRVSAHHGQRAATRLQAAMHDTVSVVTEFGRQATKTDEPIVHHGGTIDVARNPAQQRRLQAHVDEMHRFGFGEADYRFADAAEAKQWCNASGVIGGAITPHCAAVHPLRLVHALAHEVISAGGRIIEGVSVTGIEAANSSSSASGTRRQPRVRANVHDEGGSNHAANAEVEITAEIIVQATEAYSCDLPGQRRTLLPIYSMMIATEPLDDETWASIGLHDRPTFADGRNLIIYGQRTADGRFAFGGRGAPYHFGSQINPRFDTDPRIARLLREALVEMFPVLNDVAVTHHWGGVLAAPRDWTCSVQFDRKNGWATAGGYVGDGVATAALAGTVLAELISPGDRPDLTQLPIVGHQSRRWEVEPIRWLGVNTARLTARRADVAEQRQQRTARMWSGLTETLLRR